MAADAVSLTASEEGAPSYWSKPARCPPDVAAFDLAIGAAALAPGGSPYRCQRGPRRVATSLFQVSPQPALSLLQALHYYGVQYASSPERGKAALKAGLRPF